MATGITNMNYSLAKQAGLIPVGRNEDGEMEWMGTDEDFYRYDELELEYPFIN